MFFCSILSSGVRRTRAYQGTHRLKKAVGPASDPVHDRTRPPGTGYEHLIEQSTGYEQDAGCRV
jgi:hypothetical protein